MSAEDKFQLNKSIDIKVDNENNSTPVFSKPIDFLDSKTVKHRLDVKISVDQVLMKYDDRRSLHSLTPEQVSEIAESQSRS